MTPEERSLTLAALLHDVGKLGQRAFPRFPEGLSHGLRAMERLALPSYQGRYSHYHALYTGELLRVFERTPGPGLRLPQGWFEGLGFGEDFPHLALYHHNPDSDLGQVMREADWAQSEEREGGRDAAGEEREEEERRAGNFRQVPLRSIFDLVWSPCVPGAARTLGYRPARLSPDFSGGFPAAGVTPGVQDWEALWDGLQEALRHLVSFCEGLPGLSFEVFVYWLQSLLGTYTWCVPADVQNAPELPLYDHLRITSAVALAHKRSPHRCTLVLGDLGGIQRFIYRLASPGRGRGVARILRGRSFFLAVLNEFLARWLARTLDLAPTAVVWATGGNFLLLAPAGLDAALKEARARADQALFEAFPGELGLAMAWQEFPLEEACGPGCGNALQALYDTLEREKARRWADLLAKTPSRPEVGTHCAVCGSFAVKRELEGREEEERLCDPCEKFREWGRLVPHLQALAFTEPDVKLPGAAAWNLEPLGSIHLFTRLDGHIVRQCFQAPDCSPWLLTGVEEPGAIWGFRPLARTVPVFPDEEKARRATEYAHRHRLLGSGEECEEGDIASNTLLAAASVGDALLAVARADVDFLGLVMATGLPRERRTLSRISALSRSLEWFFSGRLPHLASQSHGPNGLQAPDLRRYLSCPIYIGYSGGDDLFALGPWDAVVAFLLAVEEEFRQWTGGHLSLSAGVALVKGTFPIGRASRLAGEAEEEAKRALRRTMETRAPSQGQVALLGSTLAWEDARRAWSTGQDLARRVEARELDRRFLFKIVDLLGPEEPGVDGTAPRLSLLFWPRLYYLVARTVKDEQRSALLHAFQNLAYPGGRPPDPYGPTVRSRLEAAFLTARSLTRDKEVTR